jgi:hydroxyacylglutathione hydrolase
MNAGFGTAMIGLEIISVVDEGLGHSGHVVAIDGAALVIDPLRSVDAYLAVIDRRGWRLAWTADTHTHADYVSGSPELSRRGAVFFASRGAHLAVPHRPLDGGDDVDLGGLTMRPLPTPGHTPDHLAYVLLDGGRPLAAFTGGSLMVGAVGRPDLLGPEHTDRLARAMWRSLHEQLLVLPDDVAVYPTHGAGSFCSAPGTSERSTTIGREKATNPLLQVVDEDDFVRRLVAGLGSLPAYFSWLPERNRVGFGPAPTPPLAQLSLSEVRQLVTEGAELVDVRSVVAFARSHIPAALSDVLRPAFASWLGAVVAPDRPLVFVADDSTDRVELIRQCANIGYDRIAGELAGGIDAWIAAGLPTASVDLTTVDALQGPVLDVRSDDEYRAGHLPGARQIELTSLIACAHEFTGPITVMCGHGERAATAASILARQGNRDVRIVAAGPDDWAAATNQAWEIGS